MPFMFALLPEEISATKEQIESVCKDAWISLNGTVGATNLKGSDVGGAVMKEGRIPPTITIWYIDRGDSFDEKLYDALTNKIEILTGKKVHVETIRTKLDMWFEDPEWATKECTRPHSDDSSALVE